MNRRYYSIPDYPENAITYYHGGNHYNGRKYGQCKYSYGHHYKRNNNRHQYNMKKVEYYDESLEESAFDSNENGGKGYG